MAFPEVRAVGSAAAGTAAITPGLPAGVSPGDLFLGVFESGGATTGAEATAELTIAGWAVIVTEKKGNTRLTVAYKRATGTGDRRLTNDTGDHQLGRLLCLKAGTFNEEEPIHKSAVSTQASTKSVKCPTLTTTLAECLIMFGCSGHLGTGESYSAEANAALASITERIDSATTEGDDGSILAATGTKATAGEVGESTATAAIEAERACFTIAIAPYSDPGSPKFIAKTQTAEGLESTGPFETAKPTGEATDLLLITVMTGSNKVVSVEGATAVGTPKFLSSNVLCSTFQMERGAGANIKVSWEGNAKQSIAVCMATYRNANAVESASNWEEKASSQTSTCPSITTKGPNRRVVAISTNSNANEPDEGPEGMMPRVSFTPAIADVHQAAEGATGTKSFHLAVARVTGVQTLALLKGETFNDSGSGTITVSGTKTESWGHNASPSGAVTVSGSRTENYSASNSPSGSVTFSGSATQSYSVSNSATGTISFSGSKVESYERSDNDSGTVTFSGSGVENYAHNDAGSGTVTFSGSATESHGTSYIDSTEGTIAFLGSAVESHEVTYNDSPEGTFTFSGSGKESCESSDEVLGTITFEGELSESYSASDSCEGEITFEGDSDEGQQTAYNDARTGVIVFSGSGVESFNDKLRGQLADPPTFLVLASRQTLLRAAPRSSELRVAPHNSRLDLDDLERKLILHG